MSTELEVPEELSKAQRKILAMERRLKALELRRRGWHWEQIAQEVGYKSGKTAAAGVKKLQEKTVMESVDDYRQLQIDRCHEMLQALAPKAEAGNERAIETSLRVMDKLDKLVGTEAPTTATSEVRHTLVIESSTEDDYVRRLAALSPESDRPRVAELPEGANPYMADVVDAEVVG